MPESGILRTSDHREFEVIIVDDYSDPDQDPTVFIDKYPELNINVIKMSDITETKDYFKLEKVLLKFRDW